MSGWPFSRAAIEACRLCCAKFGHLTKSPPAPPVIEPGFLDRDDRLHAAVRFHLEHREKGQA